MQSLKRTNQDNMQKNILLTVLIICGLAICIFAFWKESGDSKETLNLMDEQQNFDMYEITKLDMRTEYEKPVVIDLSVADNDGTRIEEAGDYILRGQTESTVTIDAQEQPVHLILEGVDIRSSGGPAIHVVSAGKVIITLAENTENVIRDSGNYKKYEECNAAIYSAGDITINGNGSLFVYGYYKDAIHTKDLLKIIGGDIYIQAKRNGLRGNDGMIIKPNILTVESEKTGLQTTNANQAGKGRIDICGGDISITAGEYGMVSVADVHVRECNVSCLSVMTPIKAEGEQFVEEGCFLDE